MLAERILMGLLLGGVAVGCILVLYPFFPSLLWAGILVFTTWPVCEWLRVHLRLTHTLAAGLMVLFNNGTAADALRQLSWRFGHIKQAKTGILDAFFLRYQREGEGRKSFLDWVRDDYDEAALRQDFHANGLASFINDWVLAHE